MHSRLKFAILFSLFLAATSCAEDEKGSPVGSSEHIFVYFGSIWGNSSEIEISKDGQASSMFEMNGGLDEPLGLGKRANLKTTAKQYEKIEGILKPLERKAIPEEQFNVENGDLSLGFGCDNHTTDQTMLHILWSYPNGEERFAMYYTGCHNDFSDALNLALQQISRELRASTSKKDWKKSESTFGIDKE